MSSNTYPTARSSKTPLALLALVVLVAAAGCSVPQEGQWVPQEGEICLGTSDDFARFNTESTFIAENLVAGAELCQPMDVYGSELKPDSGEAGEDVDWSLCAERRTTPALEQGSEHCAAEGFTLMCCSMVHDDHCDEASPPYVRSAEDCVHGAALPHDHHQPVVETKGS